MYLIKRISDGMWLMGHMRGSCGVPTRIWCEHPQDALPFATPIPAEVLANLIGGCVVVYKAAKEG